MPVIIRDEDRECQCPPIGGGIVIEPVPISATRTALRCMRCHGFIGYWEDTNAKKKITEKKTRIRPTLRDWSFNEAQRMI